MKGDTLQQNIRNYLMVHKRRTRWMVIFSILAVLVLFVTTYALISPAQTLEESESESEIAVVSEEVTDSLGLDGSSFAIVSVKNQTKAIGTDPTTVNSCSALSCDTVTVSIGDTTYKSYSNNFVTSDSTMWTFEWDSSGGGYYIYTVVDGTEKYLRLCESFYTENGASGTDGRESLTLVSSKDDATLITVNYVENWAATGNENGTDTTAYSGYTLSAKIDNQSDTSYINYNSGDNSGFWCSNYGTCNTWGVGNFVFLLCTKTPELYELDGKSFAITSNGEGNTSLYNAITTNASGNGLATINIKDYLLGIKDDNTDTGNSEELAVTSGSGVTLWTFEYVSGGNTYYIYDNDNGTKLYLSIGNGTLSTSTTAVEITVNQYDSQDESDISGNIGYEPFYVLGNSSEYYLNYNSGQGSDCISGTSSNAYNSVLLVPQAKSSFTLTYGDNSITFYMKDGAGNALYLGGENITATENDLYVMESTEEEGATVIPPTSSDYEFVKAVPVSGFDDLDTETIESILAENDQFTFNGNVSGSGSTSYTIDLIYSSTSDDLKLEENTSGYALINSVYAMYFESSALTQDWFTSVEDAEAFVFKKVDGYTNVYYITYNGQYVNLLDDGSFTLSDSPQAILVETSGDGFAFWANDSQFTYEYEITSGVKFTASGESGKMRIYSTTEVAETFYFFAKGSQISEYAIVKESDTTILYSKQDDDETLSLTWDKLTLEEYTSATSLGSNYQVNWKNNATTFYFIPISGDDYYIYYHARGDMIRYLSATHTSSTTPCKVSITQAGADGEHNYYQIGTVTDYNCFLCTVKLPDTVEATDSKNTKVNLFDYWVDSEINDIDYDNSSTSGSKYTDYYDMGINKNTYLLFTPAGPSEDYGTNANKYTGSKSVFAGIVNAILSSDGLPILTNEKKFLT